MSKTVDHGPRIRSKRRSPYAAGAVAAVAAIALLAAACGSSASSSTSSAAAKSSPSASALKSAPIVLGNVGSFTGPAAGDTANVPKILQGWVTYTNANGGIDGHPVKVISLDSGGAAATEVADVHTLIQSDHVVALIATTGSLEADWASYAQSQNVPVVGGDAYDTTWMTNPDFFPDTTTILGQLAMSPAVAKADGKTTVGTILCSENAVCAQAIPVFKLAAQKLGLKTGYSGVVASDLPSYTATCLTAKSSGDTAIVLGFAELIGEVHMVDNCASQGYKPLWILPSTAYSPLMLTDPNFNGAAVPTPIFPFVDTASPAVAAFVKASAKAGVPASQLTFSDATAWASGMEFEQAAKNAGGMPTSASVLSGLYQFKNETLDGLTPPLTFTKGQPTSVNCYYNETIENGKLVASDGLQTSCLTASELPA